MEIKVFGRKECPDCKLAMMYVDEATMGCEGVKWSYYDMDSIDGLAEGALNEIIGIPTILILDGECVVARWSGTLPTRDELSKMIRGSLH